MRISAISHLTNPATVWKLTGATAAEEKVQAARLFPQSLGSVVGVTEHGTLYQDNAKEAVMAQENWRLEGEWIKNCTCAYGCPCDFNAKPTNGDCKGFLGMRIKKGHFEQTNLDGLSFFVNVHFPGALHEGNGEAQPIIEERATPEQRDALFQIMSGKHSAEGTLFHIFSMIVTKMHDPIPGAIISTVEPIKNPVTGAPHRIRVVMPEGFEHIEGEVASATIHTDGAIRYDTQGSHSTLANVVQTPEGVAG